MTANPDKAPIATAGRRRRRHKRFPLENPSCILCGEPNLECLTPVTVDWLKAHRVLIELHHPACEQNDPDFVVAVCLNCHRKLHEGLAKAGVSMRPESNPKTRVAVMLEALAVFLSMLAEAVLRWAALLRQSTALDVPGE
jgi:hypothetical protein